MKAAVPRAARRNPPPDRAGWAGHVVPANAAEELWYRGLIAFAEFGEGPLEYIYIPDLPILGLVRQRRMARQ